MAEWRGIVDFLNAGMVYMSVKSELHFFTGRYKPARRVYGDSKVGIVLVDMGYPVLFL